ncbi:DUF2911 domain-containing protein [Mucilaginibacter ginsenosidivorans]|uniref:DUF2911 domain-containing protein n=1 Tax=Mucilaginibacter ginsenosidivorans TaxID=398053 RepID=A0A5B8UUW3_9SPHI|nr:DUF2911 domain-containing protein [Mucilaginibacter ginsenosidivorans]QEC62844.1 DUF2911 domain-containing protein [Mucilaginibacter ginsenosidivorans]
MKKTFIYLAALFAFGSLNTQAQDLVIPQPSTKQIITQELGLGKITLTYSRPNVKGRKVFGQMEPYGLVWRTGANYATTLQFTDEVTIEGQKVPAGEYALFSIPGEKDWTFILNKTAKQWGAYNYKESDDLVRFKVPVMKAPRFNETLTINFVDATNTGCSLLLDWENTEVALHLTTDMDAQVMSNIDKLMQGEKKPYYFASIYYYNHDKDISKALEWITIHDKNQPNAFNVKYWKARIQLKAGDKKGAIATANDGLKLATDENSAEYIRLNKEVIAQAEGR